MFTSIATILATVVGIVARLLAMREAQGQQDVGHDRANLDALLKEKEDAAARAKTDAEVARMDKPSRDARLDRWMRD